MQTNRRPAECVSIFQECIGKRPLRLKIFPFRCDAPQVSDGRAHVAASFKLAEPYGMVAMDCERQGDITVVEFSTGGNIRGRVTAKSMAKAIAARLSE